MLPTIVLVVLAVVVFLFLQLSWEVASERLFTWAFRRGEDGKFSAWQIFWQAIVVLLAVYVVTVAVRGAWLSYCR